MRTHLFISTGLTGKLKGIDALSVSAYNPVCDKLALDPTLVCHQCYARQYESFRPIVHAAYEDNTELLTGSFLADAELPTINAPVFRFHAFGEIINTTHYVNLRRIAGRNPETTFALWSKRDIASWGYQRKPNLIHVTSSPVIGQRRTDSTIAPIDAPFYDYEFTVYRTMADVPDDAFLCHGKTCLDCMHCYQKGNTYHVAELLK